jgi:hypothetical protein
MSNDELHAIYRKAWDLYYSPAHVERVLRRAGHWGYDTRNMMMKLLTFQAVPKLEGLHPLEGGLFRRKRRGERRPGLPLEGRWAFYSREIWAMVSKHVHFVRMYWGYRRILRRVERDAATQADVAMTPVRPSDFEQLEDIHGDTGSEGCRREGATPHDHASEGAELTQHGAGSG